MLPLHPPQRTRVLSAPMEGSGKGKLINIAGLPELVLQSLGSGEEGNARLQTSAPLLLGCGRCIDAGTLVMFPESVRRKSPTQSTN